MNKYRDMSSDHSFLLPDESRRFLRAVYLHEVFFSIFWHIALLTLCADLRRDAESRYAGQWPIHGVRIGALLRNISLKRPLGDWPQQSVFAVFGAPQGRTCELHSFQPPPRVSELDW
jgi:hypothetical protein